METPLMAADRSHEPDPYVAVRPEFILKVDGSRPILYPLDVADSHIYYLTPRQGLALSMLDGTRPVSVARNLFARVLPDQPEGSFDRILARVEHLVRQSSPPGGVGSGGVLETSGTPIRDACSYDPRHFVPDAGEYAARTADPRTRYRLDTPIHVYTVFTHRCVTNCVYCYAQRPAVRELPAERWADLLDEMVDLGIHLASPDNGDVPARPDGLRLLEMLVERGILFLLSTKAPLGPADVARLVDAGFAAPVRGRVRRPVQLSIDAVDDDVCRRLLRVSRPHTAEHLRTFLAFRDAGITPKIKAVVTGWNTDQLLPLVTTYRDLGARSFSFVRYERSHYRHRDDLSLTPDHLDAVRRQLDTVRERYPDVLVEENLTHRPGPADTDADDAEGADAADAARRRAARWDERAGCGGGWSALGIAADGSAFLCEQMVLDEPYVVGDAATQSLREIWDGARLRDFIFPVREQFAGTPCAGCAGFEECMWLRGRCYRDAFFAHGSIYHPPPLCPNNVPTEPIPIGPMLTGPTPTGPVTA